MLRRAERLEQRLGRRAPADRVTLGLPRYTPTASRPCTLDDRHQAAVDLGEGLVPRRLGGGSPSRLISAVRTRSGSSCSCLSVDPFGQMNPWLNTSSRSPRILVTRMLSTVISSPHPASQRGAGAMRAFGSRSWSRRRCSDRVLPIEDRHASIVPHRWRRVGSETAPPASDGRGEADIAVTSASSGLSVFELLVRRLRKPHQHHEHDGELAVARPPITAPCEWPSSSRWPMTSRPDDATGERGGRQQAGRPAPVPGREELGPVHRERWKDDAGDRRREHHGEPHRRATDRIREHHRTPRRPEG